MPRSANVASAEPRGRRARDDAAPASPNRSDRRRLASPCRARRRRSRWLRGCYFRKVRLGTWQAPISRQASQRRIERAQRRTTPLESGGNRGASAAVQPRDAACANLCSSCGRQHLGRDRALERRARQARDLVVHVLVDLAGRRMRAQDRLQRRRRQRRGERRLDLADERAVLIGADGDRARLDALEQPRQRDQRLETRCAGIRCEGQSSVVFPPRIGEAMTGS